MYVTDRYGWQSVGPREERRRGPVSTAPGKLTDRTRAYLGYQR